MMFDLPNHNPYPWAKTNNRANQYNFAAIFIASTVLRIEIPAF